jgi:medium-chain acyl-[acyl-carrier-protein] hydrolase
MHEDSIVYETKERVSSFECDFQRRWKPASIFQHLTEAATVHAGQLGFGFETMLARNLFWVHARMKIKFLSFPQAEDEIIIRTWPKTIQQKLFYIRDFEMLNHSGLPLVLATSAWLVIDATKRRMIPPRSLDFNLPSFPEKAGLDEPLDKLGLDGGEERLCVRAGYSVVDMLGHVNNSRYVEWISDVFPMEMYKNNTLDWMQINYDHEVRPGEEVALLVKERAEKDATWQVVGNNRSNDTLAFEALLHWRK